MSQTFSPLDYPQVLKNVHDITNQALAVKNITGGLITVPYDAITLSYVPSGNGAGSIYQVMYYVGGTSGTLVGTLTLGYDSNDNLTSVAKS